MHIPDGFLDTKTWAALAVTSAGLVGLASRKVKTKLDEAKIPLLGLVAAFVFAAQLVNFPIAGGTSGHFLGGMLAALLVGPWAATLVLTVVLLVQALVFGDGGLLALGANIFNLAILGVWSGYFTAKPFLAFNNIKTKKIGIFLGSWIAVVLAASACAFEVWISGIVPLTVFPLMIGIHALIGLAEGLITLAAYDLIFQVRPDILVFKGEQA